MTDGYKCPSCGHEEAQTVIPALGHKPIIDPAVSATCQQAGHTIGSYCEYCHEVYVQSQIIPKLAHTVVIDEAIPADCTHTGLTQGSHCSACGEIIRAQVETKALGHKYEIVPSKPAGYFHVGLTDGVQCSRCGEWLIEQQSIPMLKGEGVFCDIDGDGEITVTDATFIQRKLADIEIPYDIPDALADANDDGILDITDVTYIQRWLSDMLPDSHIGEQIPS